MAVDFFLVFQGIFLHSEFVVRHEWLLVIVVSVFFVQILFGVGVWTGNSIFPLAR